MAVKGRATKSQKRPVRDTWIANFNIDVQGKRLLWLLGTGGRRKWVAAERYRSGDTIRITIERIEPRKA